MSDLSETLLAILRDPHRLGQLKPRQWDVLLPQARCTHLHGRLAALAREQRLYRELPDKVQHQLIAAETLAADNRRMTRWEVRRILRALNSLEIPVVLLKGAAYAEARLPPARGRLMSDVDIMVPQAAIKRVEFALQRHGWEFTKLTPYDQRYYRTWMHELPPLQHPARRVTVDVHHSILPPTSRRRLDPEKLWQMVQPLDRAPLHVLSPVDLVLHSATHLFHDGDLRLSIRDLVDIHDLLFFFAKDDTFYDQLLQRARDLDLARPLYYALHFGQRLLGVPIPKRLSTSFQSAKPSWPTLALMNQLVPPALLPVPEKPTTTLSRNLLYLRSHWLRMPPHLLTLHLTRKAFMRVSASEARG